MTKNEFSDKVAIIRKEQEKLEQRLESLKKEFLKNSRVSVDEKIMVRRSGGDRFCWVSRLDASDDGRVMLYVNYKNINGERSSDESYYGFDGPRVIKMKD